MSTVVSSDGSVISTTSSGAGPLVVLVDPAMSTHKDSTKLAALLADTFTVVTFDRRGRGNSTDASPTTAELEHEVDDIRAVMHDDRAILFGSSSGAALVLEAAARLGDQVAGVFLYEPPFIVDDSRPPIDPALPRRIADLVSRGDLSAAVKAFFVEAVGVPAFGVAIMRMLPLWKTAKAVVPTVRYDFAALAGTQDGRPLPAGRWAAVTASGIVMVGSQSEPFFHSGARALANAVPKIEYEMLEGGNHGSPQMAPAGIAARLKAKFA